jgi:endonuclease I
MTKFKSLFLLLLNVVFYSVNAQKGPENQPTNLQFFQLKPWEVNLSFQQINADGYVIVKNTTGDNPILNKNTFKTDWINGAKVIYKGQGSIFTDKEIQSNTTYYYFIFSYNEQSDSMYYCNSKPLSGAVTTPKTLSQNTEYYESINPNDSSLFIGKLGNLISDHVLLDYNAFGFELAENIHIRDTLSNLRSIDCQYSRENILFSNQFNFQNNNLSREHVMPRSWMPSGGNTNNKDGADYHNLLIVNNSEVNIVRSNYPFDYVQTVSKQYIESKLGKNIFGATVFEVADNIKGDVARCIFYMQVAYNGTANSNWGFKYLPSNGKLQNSELLMDWHKNDPPDADERTRHEYIAYFQKNRNPFIDYPHWACYIDFHTLEYKNATNSECEKNLNTLALKKVDISSYLNVYPNPSSGTFVLQFPQFIEQHDVIQLYLTNTLGKKIPFEWEKESHKLTINGTSGLYKLHFRAKHYSATKTIVIH